MATTLTTQMNGTTYKAVLTEICGRPTVWIRVLRELKDGKTVWAFLSARQHKAEDAVRRRFAREINEHMKKVGA